MAILCHPKHEKFCHLIVKGMTQTDAYVEAGFTRNPLPDGTMPSGGNAYRLFEKPHIQRRIQELQGRAAARIELTEAAVLAEMAKLAFHNPSDFLKVNDDGTANVDLSELTRDQMAAITEVQSTTTIGSDGKPITTTKIKLADKKAALQDLGRHFGSWVDRTENGKPGDFADISTREAIVEKIRQELGEADAMAFAAMLDQQQATSKGNDTLN
jgi:phage terminase small subunit